MTVKNKRGGFSLLELAVAMLIIAILVVVVILMVTGFFSTARARGLETDLRVVKTAVDAFATEGQGWPTASGNLPSSGKYAPIDFDASLERAGKTLTFYPHYIIELPKHWDEGVWLIDSASRVSVDIPREEY